MFPPNQTCILSTNVAKDTKLRRTDETSRRQGRRRDALADLFSRVLLPMAVPILMEGNLTLAVGSKYFLHDQRFQGGDFAAAAVLSGLPITLVFLLAQRWIVSGLTAGGVKG